MVRRLTLIALCFGLLVPVVADASDGTLGAPSFDNVGEATHKRLSWEDFKGDGRRPPGWNRWSRGSFAHIATTIRMARFEVDDRQDGDEWVAVAVGIRPYAVMDKYLSAVKHGSRNDYALAHEQIHFDIAELSARRLAVELAALEGRGASPTDATEDLHRRIRQHMEQGFEQLNALQARYDGETQHGVNKKKQKKWARQVPEMFREATESLAALLAKGAT